jgi:hypothetical protein
MSETATIAIMAASLFASGTYATIADAIAKAREIHKVALGY